MKSDLGKVAKVILDKINASIRGKTDLVQWWNSFKVIAWFDKSSNKNNFNFFKYDICVM